MAEFLRSKNLENLSRIKHGFFTRKGGVSADDTYASLNCGFGSNDSAANVTQNRARVARALGAQKSSLITPYQTHSADVIVATEAWTPDKAPKADAVVTTKKGLAIGILTADCGPVLLADEKAGIVAAAHAGWRGAIGGVLEATIATMIRLGAKRSRISSALGPCLHQACYEVGPEFQAQFTETDPDYARFFSHIGNNERPHFDLPGFIMYRLEQAGLEEIANTATCTYENESLFFSFRRNTHQNSGDYGRQISAIVLT